MNTRLLRHPQPVERQELDAMLAVDAYLTDGANLFRCLSRHDSNVILENCLTLDAILVPVADLTDGGMRPVKRAAHPTALG